MADRQPGHAGVAGAQARLLTAGAPGSSPAHDFAYSREQFQQMVDDALALAKSIGATDAATEVSEGAGLSVSVRKERIETEGVDGKTTK